MLADKLAAVADELVCSFLFSGLIVPGTGEGHFHGSGGADGACAEEEGGVTGNDFRVGECADVADLGLVLGELTVGDHLVEFETGSDTGEVTAFIDGSESIVVVCKALGVSLGTGSVAELNLGEFLCSLDHEVLMAEGVSEDDIAAGICKLGSRVVALLAFGNVGAEDDLIIAQAEVRAGFLGTVHEVEVIGGVLIMQENKTDLQIGSGSRVGSGCLGCSSVSRRGFGCSGCCGLAAGAQCKYHAQSHEQSNDLLHLFSLLDNFL